MNTHSHLSCLVLVFGYFRQIMISVTSALYMHINDHLPPPPLTSNFTSSNPHSRFYYYQHKQFHHPYSLFTNNFFEIHRFGQRVRCVWLVLSIYENFLIEIDRNRSDSKNRSDQKSFIKNRWSISQFFNLKFLVTLTPLLVALSYDKMAQ